MIRYHQFGTASSIMGCIVTIILIVIGLYAALMIMKAIIKDNKIKFGNYSALAILAERYAKGEISDDEYEHKKSILKGLTITIKKNKSNNSCNEKENIFIDNEIMDIDNKESIIN